MTVNRKTKQCPYCGEEININAKKCRFCKEWLEDDCNERNIPPNEENFKIGTFAILSQIFAVALFIVSFFIECPFSTFFWDNIWWFTLGNAILVIIAVFLDFKFEVASPIPLNFSNILKFFVVVAIVSIVYDSFFNNTIYDLVNGCSESEEKLVSGGMAVSKTYTCDNKPYTHIIQTSMTMLAINPSYRVYKNNSLVAKMFWDYNFKKYDCAYYWDQEPKICNEKSFVSTIKQHLKENKNIINIHNDDNDYIDKNVDDKKVHNNSIDANKKSDTTSSNDKSDNVKTSQNAPTKKTETEKKSNSKSSATTGGATIKKNSNSLSKVTPVDTSHKSETYDYFDSVQNLGLQTNSQKADWGPYMRELERRIKRNWNPPKGDVSKRAVVLFKINRDGRLSAVKVLKSSGHPETDRAAIAAVELTAPFRALPSEFKGKDIDIEFTFDYNVLKSGY